MMVKLAAMTTDEAEVYQIGGEPVDEAEVQSKAVEQCGVTDGTLAEGEQVV